MKVVVGAFSGSSLGHVVRCCRLARALVDSGHEVRFFSGEVGASLALTHGLRVDLVPELPPLASWPKGHLAGDELRAAARKRSAAPDFLRACLEAEERLLDDVRPDVLVADWRNTLCVLGRLRSIPTVNVLNPHLLEFPIRFVLPVISESLLELGVPQEGVDGILGDALALVGLSCFEPLRGIPLELWQRIRVNVREVRYVGPVLPTLPPPHSARRGAYVSFGGSPSGARMLESSLPSLGQLDTPLSIHRSGRTSDEVSALLGGRAGADYETFDNDIACIERLARAAVAVVHGGHGTLYECLATATPTLVVPTNAEQLQNGEILARLGVGLVHPLNGATPAQLLGSVDTLLREPSFRARALEVQQSLFRKGGADRLVDFVAELAGQRV